MPEHRILIAEDEALLRETLARCLRDAGHAVTAVADGDAAHAALTGGQFDLLLTDLKMPGRSGLELVQALPELSPGTIAIVITGFATIATAVEVMKAGAFDYLTKPLVNSEVMLLVARALDRRREDRTLALYRRTAGEGAPLIGDCPAIAALRAAAARAAASDATVLITGESGTGKEVVANLLHRAGPRAASPLVAVNCAALPEHLLESELFGHVRGAFTGASEDKPGLLELADGGAIFLDEIGEMSPSLQARLLRVLEDRSFRRVGGTRQLTVDVRFLAATNRDLAAAVAGGSFRADLFYRLNVVNLTLPPLRERGNDILLLADHCLRGLAHRYRRPATALTAEARTALLAWRWPGNVRELFNCLERALVLAPPGDLTATALGLAPAAPATAAPVAIDCAVPFKTARHQVVAAFEQRYLAMLISACDGNISEAARRAGLSRLAMRDKLARYQIPIRDQS